MASSGSEILTKHLTSTPDRRARIRGMLRRIPRMSALWWIAYDALAASFCLWLVHQHGRTPSAYEPGLVFGVFPAVFVVTSYVAGLYERQIFLKRPTVLIVLFFCVGVSLALLVVYSSVFLYQPISRYVLMFAFLPIYAVTLAPRLIIIRLVKRFKVRLLVVGDRNDDRACMRFLREGGGFHEVVDYCDKEQTGGNHISDIPRVCREQDISQVIVTRPYLDSPEVFRHCFDTLKIGCEVMDLCSFFERTFEMVPVDFISHDWFYSAHPSLHQHFEASLKRTIDTVISGICFTLTLPLFVIIWVLIKVTSPGPAFFKQERIGQFGRPFVIYKFRTMKYEPENGNGSSWTEKNDGRTTAVGRVLRKTRLDEIPQFWNILKGDMSFVGPRPEQPDLVEQIAREVPFFTLREWARPGLTGLAQIRYRYGNSIEDARHKLQYDLYYIKNWSPLLDIKIILRTFTAIMKGAW